MSEDPLRHWPDRTPLYDDDGRLLVVFTRAEGTRNGRPWADGLWRPADVSIQTATEVVVDTFAGWAVSLSDPGLGAALVERGASTLRHAHLMSHRLVELAPVPPGPLRLEPLTASDVERTCQRLGEIALAAYPSTHPDHAHADVEQAAGEIAAIGRGELLGPLLDVSRLAMHGHDAVGACLVVDRPGRAPEGGPWVIDLFRDPAAQVRGVGRALLTASMTAASTAGLPSLSLAVSHSNTAALRLYSSLGFDDAEQSWTLAVPG